MNEMYYYTKVEINESPNTYLFNMEKLYLNEDK